MERRISVVITMQRALGLSVTSPEVRGAAGGRRPSPLAKAQITPSRLSCPLESSLLCTALHRPASVPHPPVISPTSPNSSASSRYFWLDSACAGRMRQTPRVPACCTHAAGTYRGPCKQASRLTHPTCSDRSNRQPPAAPSAPPPDMHAGQACRHPPHLERRGVDHALLLLEGLGDRVLGHNSFAGCKASNQRGKHCEVVAAAAAACADACHAARQPPAARLRTRAVGGRGATRSQPALDSTPLQQHTHPTPARTPPAPEVCAATSTDSRRSMQAMAVDWNGSRANGYCLAGVPPQRGASSVPAAVGRVQAWAVGRPWGSGAAASMRLQHG